MVGFAIPQRTFTRSYSLTALLNIFNECSLQTHDRLPSKVLCPVLPATPKHLLPPSYSKVSYSKAQLSLRGIFYNLSERSLDTPSIFKCEIDLDGLTDF